jgi:circadian clock protein KaiC
MRAAQEAREQATGVARKQEIERKQRELERKRRALEAQITALRAEFEAVEEEAKLISTEDQAREDALGQERADMGHRRGRDGAESISTAHNVRSNRKPTRKD